MTNKTESEILVLGLGVSGYAAAELALYHGSQVRIVDENDSPELREKAAALKERGVAVTLDYNPARHKTPEPELAIISPGIGEDSILWQTAQSLSCSVISEIEFAYRYARCPVIAVTGTNGKSTTVELINYCLQHCGYRSQAAGNVGYPFSEAVRRYPALDYVIVEASSFQLERIDRFTPQAAALLNLTPDHLDRHGTVDNYFRSKLQMFKNISDPRHIVIRSDLVELPLLRQVLPGGETPITFNTDTPAGVDFFLADDGNLVHRCPGGKLQVLCHRTDLRLRGRHNVENVLATFAVAACIGIDLGEMLGAVKTFPPHPNRLELINVRDGIQFFNDSKATNPDSTIRAIQSVAEETKGGIVLIAGGLDKGLAFSGVEPLLAEHVKEVELIGKCRQKLAEEWGQIVPCRIFASLESAVESALETAISGDTVLLSPGCASQDMFDNYIERGQTFNEIVKRRIGE